MESTSKDSMLFFLTAEQIAHHLGTWPEDVLRRARKKEFPSHKLYGQTLFLLEEVLATVQCTRDFLRTQRLKVALSPFTRPQDRLRALEHIERAVPLDAPELPRKKPRVPDLHRERIKESPYEVVEDEDEVTTAHDTAEQVNLEDYL